MPLEASDRLAELGDFLAALRVNGVPVGPSEIERLRHLFACAPCLDRAGLKALLAALLVKTPAQRQNFEGLFAAWCPDDDADWLPAQHAARESSATPAKDVGGEGKGEEGDQSTFVPPPPPPDLWKRWVVAGAALLLVALLCSLSPPLPSAVGQIPPPTEAVQPPPRTANSDPELPDQPVSTVWTWRTDDVAPASIRLPNRLGPLPLALLGAGALALALGLLWRYRRRFPVITARPQAYRGFGWQPLPPPARDDGALIDARARRQLVWNIERFVADDPTRRLDLPRTVERTARAGGCVRFCFQPAVYQRAVWFWLDRHLERPTAKEIAAQLAATLRAAGLEARQGFFTDAPLHVDWPEQSGYRPLVEEGQGRQAQVAIFSDGAGLRRRLENPLHGDETLRLLGAFQHWPRLCFVDCSAGGVSLAALFAKHKLRLDVVALPQVAGWLGAVGSTAAGLTSAAAGLTTADTGLSGAARQWAAAVALGGGAADAETAQTLRAALELPVSAWEVDRIVAAAAQPEDRRRLLNWLLRSEPCDGEALRVDSLARRALAWWQARYVVADAEKRAQENPLLPWRGSLASRRCRDQGLPAHARQPARERHAGADSRRRGSRVELALGGESDNAVHLAGGAGVLLRAGSLAQPIRACTAGWPQRSLVVVAAPYSERSARQLAVRLLDKGSADQVLVGTDWEKLLDDWRGPSQALKRNTQVLVIVPPGGEHAAAERLLQDHPGPSAIVSADDLAALARAIDFAGAQPVGQAALPWRVLATGGEARIFFFKRSIGRSVDRLGRDAHAPKPAAPVPAPGVADDPARGAQERGRGEERAAAQNPPPGLRLHRSAWIGTRS